MQVGTPRTFSPLIRKRLLETLNGLRVLEIGRRRPKPLKSIRKPQYQLGLTADETYALIEDLSNATEYLMLRTDGENALRSIFNEFMGQTVIINCIGFNTKDRKDAYTIDVNTFEMYKKRYWIDSEDWYWSEHGGRIVVTTSDLLTPENIQQLYRENETNTCVFDALLNHLGTTKTAERTRKTIEKYKKLHPDGVNEADMESLMNKMKIRVKIYMPFNEIPKEYGHAEKYTMMVNMLNVRRDHVVPGNNMLSNPIEYVVGTKSFCGFCDGKGCSQCPSKITLTSEEGDFFNLNKTTIYKPDKTIKLDNRYRREQEAFFKQFIPLDNKKDYALSQFVLGGTYQTGSFLFKQTKKANHIDHIRSYSQFKNRMYKGFPQRFTDFRMTKEIQGVGYYYVKSLDWTHADKKLKQFNQKCLMYVGDRIYPSVEIEMLQSYGVEVRIMYGAWGTTIDFEFTPEQHDKIDDVRIYAKMIGTMCHMTKNVEIYTHTQDPKWIAHVGGDVFGDLAKFTIPMQTHNHHANIAGFIYAYQRINLIAQLMEMDIEKIGRINVDGIYYEEHAFNLLDDFVVKDGKYPNASGERFICELDYDRKAVIRQVLTTTPRQHFMTELFKGAGGTGKSYYNLNDKGLHRPLYVAVCRLQLQGKGRDTATLASLFNEKRWETVNKYYDVMIVDECSMINESEKNYLLKFQGKIIFIGDVDYQLEPVKDVRMSEIGFENVREMKTQYRCKCDKLQSILNDVRMCIDKKKYYYGNFKSSSLSDYKREDVILCHTHSTIYRVNKMIDLPVKYRITENGDGVFNGEIYLDKPKGKFEETHAFTVHTLQGQTAEHNVWIHKEIFENTKLLYTALSRAKTIEQIKIFYTS